MKVASIDMGSNTFLLLVCEVLKNSKTLKVISDHSRTVRLAEGLQSYGKITSQALGRAESCLKEYKKIIDKNNVDKIICAATSAARDAKNFKEFSALGDQNNIPISIISGEEEARLTFLGTTYDFLERNLEDFFVVDVGGGSTEFVSQENGKLSKISVDVGSVRLFEKFHRKEIWKNKELEDLDQDIIQIMSRRNRNIKKLIQSKSFMIATAGTPTHLTLLDQGISFDENKINGHRINLKRLDYLREKIAQMSIKDRIEKLHIDVGRADVILYGTSILINVMRFFDIKEFRVSSRGVRYGLAFEALNL